jgi:DDE superfamily endonuclease
MKWVEFDKTSDDEEDPADLNSAISPRLIDCDNGAAENCEEELECMVAQQLFLDATSEG